MMILPNKKLFLGFCEKTYSPVTIFLYVALNLISLYYQNQTK